MKFKNTEVWGFEHAIRGMRNPKNSWHISDSYSRGCIFDKQDFEEAKKDGCINKNAIWEDYLDRPEDCYQANPFVIGKNDLELAQKLIKAGSEHRKFMRQIFVSVDITASLFWFKEFDTYKVGTVANSTSTMHKLATTPITKECFETDDYDNKLFNSPDLIWYDGHNTINRVDFIIETCEKLRQKYLETKDKRYWKELIRWLPESWLQTRTVTMDYENLLAMCSKGQRRYHKLNEWSGQDNPECENFISWARALPYAQELIFLDELEDKN